ncbi:hypothetical protein KCP73_13650 [Salmonella enterica subsp. enterica]|nr:hypothetical protein KCP73_13650 [Salmonella enterica subsp. enterica]
MKPFLRRNRRICHRRRMLNEGFGITGLAVRRHNYRLSGDCQPQEMLNVFWQIKVIVCEASRRLHVSAVPGRGFCRNIAGSKPGLPR